MATLKSELRFRDVADVKAVIEALEKKGLPFEKKGYKALRLNDASLSAARKIARKLGADTVEHEPDAKTRQSKDVPKKAVKNKKEKRVVRRPSVEKKQKSAGLVRPMIRLPSARDAKKVSKLEFLDSFKITDGANLVSSPIPLEDAVGTIRRSLARELKKMNIPYEFVVNVGKNGETETPAATKAKAKTKAKQDEPVKGKPVWHMNVESSNISSVRYFPVTQVLYVKFRSGSEYKYRDVSAKEFLEFSLSESHGRYFIHRIKATKEAKQVS